MGLAESKLKPQSVKPLVRADTITPLPSLTIDSCKFTDGSFGFLIQTVDLAKNMSSYTVSLKTLYQPYDKNLVYVGTDQTILSFTKDLLSGLVFCVLNRQQSGQGPIYCECVSIYEAIGDERIDKLSLLFK